MNSRYKSGSYVSILALLAWCMLPAPSSAQVLEAWASGFINVDGFSYSASAVSTRCIGECFGESGVPCTGDEECIVGCEAFPDARCSGNPTGVTTVFDDVDSGPISICPTGFGLFTLSGQFFSWFSVTELPGGMFFPKIFSAANTDSFPINTNAWQTTSPVEAMPGIVRIQDVCLPTTPASSPFLGPIHFFNAMAWSPDFSGAAAASVEAINSLSLVSSSTLGHGEGSQVRLESAVDEFRPGLFVYEYTLENASPDTVTISWDSANLTRTLGPYETIVVTQLSDFGARESQGYAHVTDLDGEPIVDLISMALVPVQASSPPPDRGDRVGGKTKSRGDRRR